MDALADELAEFAEGTRGNLRLSASGFGLMHKLQQDIATFRLKHPLAMLEFRTISSQQVITALLKEEIDVGVFVSNEVPQGLTTQVYEEDDLVLLVPEGHPLSSRKAVGLAEVAEFELVFMPPGSNSSSLTSDQARRRGLRLRSSIEVCSLDAMVLLVRSGLGIAIAPSQAWIALGPFRGLVQLPNQRTLGAPPGARCHAVSHRPWDTRR